MKELTYELENDNIDYFHMYNVFETIKKWFSKNVNLYEKQI